MENPPTGSSTPSTAKPPSPQTGSKHHTAMWFGAIIVILLIAGGWMYYASTRTSQTTTQWNAVPESKRNLITLADSAGCFGYSGKACLRSSQAEKLEYFRSTDFGWPLKFKLMSNPQFYSQGGTITEAACVALNGSEALQYSQSKAVGTGTLETQYRAIIFANGQPVCQFFGAGIAIN